MHQCRANIRIYSDIRIFVSDYSIFEYEYWKFDFSNIFVFIFDHKLCFEYLSPNTGYSNTNIDTNIHPTLICIAVCLLSFRYWVAMSVICNERLNQISIHMLEL